MRGITLAAVVWTLTIIAVLVGYVMNIIDLIMAINDPITALFILRCVGVFFFPLGAVLGYF